MLGLIQSGDMRALAIASDNKAPQLPDVPLLKEQGVSGGEADAWLALFAPAKTPAPVLRYAVQGGAGGDRPSRRWQPTPSSRASPSMCDRAPAFRAYQEAELAKWGDVVRVAKVKVDG